MSKKPIKKNKKTNLFDSEYINLIKENIEKDISRLKKDIQDTKETLNNKINLIESKIDKRLDGVDEALRGNGRVGLFEQMRNTKWKFKVILFCFILLFGFKVFGKTLDDLLSKKETPMVKVEAKSKKVIESDSSLYMVEGLEKKVRIIKDNNPTNNPVP